MAELSPQDIERLRRQLDAREAELQAEVKRVREEQAERPSMIARNQNEDLGEQGEERLREAVRYAEQERDVLELREIEAAKERMDAGTYGMCVDCGRDIPLARLNAQPHAKRCLECQAKYERTHHVGPSIAPNL
ncbi:MAG TPA: TraR/DksA C4-type zinc finger protein [Burkholderiaceae bacterium]|nr:TraR/DksA C4-type zinc finger protein [Burkholderiaceae bacterium]